MRDIAERHWEESDAPVAESVMLTITYFFTDKQMDVDNIPKPISDALNGLTYVDDEQVTDILCRKRNLNNDALRIESASPIVNEAARRGVPFIYIRVEIAPDQNVIR